MFRRILTRQLVGSKGAFAYAVHPAIGERFAFQILRYSFYKTLRGLAIRHRFGRASGLVLVGRGVRITHPQMISCGRGFVVEDGAELHGLSRDGLRFGDNVTVGRGAQVRPSGYYGRSLGAGVVVGNNSNIGPLCYLGASGGIEIGSDVLMAPGVTILSEDHNYNNAQVTISSQGVRDRKTVIEDDVWLGACALILGGSHIGQGAVVAAGALVKGDVPPFAVVAGVPARVLRQRGT